jgi:GT2 family glycosyltransferase
MRGAGGGSPGGFPGYGCVVLTQGGRPDELDRSLHSLLRQRDVEVDVAVVGNGWEPTGLPEGVRGVGLAEDVGIPAGRNAGVPHVDGDLLFFLDDDASLLDEDALARVAARFAAEPDLGLLQLRVVPRDGGPASRDWVPRLRVTDRERSSDVTLVWEGAVAMRRRVFDEVGGWPGEFRFVHEGVDLAWRVMDAGLRVAYAGDIAVEHPPPPPVRTRHGYSTYYGARNRVWLARRYLPLPLGAVFVATFAARTLPRLREPGQLRAAARGYRDGMRGSAGPRRRLRPSTLWRMTRAGRPPLI